MATTDERDAGHAAAQTVKKRAACDECRMKKLKCTGEQPSCARCVREEIVCVYSPQKQMGRPKKRGRIDAEEYLDDQSTQAPHQPAGEDTSLEAGSSSAPSFPPWQQMLATWPDLSNDISLPGLTPDRISDSSTLPDLLPQSSISNHGGTNDSATYGNHQSRIEGSGSGLLIDSYLGGSNVCSVPGPMPTCSCLSSLYLTMNSLQTMDPSFPFPFALHTLHGAIQTAATVLDCPECPTRFISGMLNTQMLGTLLMSIADRFGKFLESISLESFRAEAAGETKRFRLADANESTPHLHTGGLNCLAAFDLSLSPEEWRTMCKKMIRAEVYGPADGDASRPYFLGITKRMTKRQERWHESPLPVDSPRDASGHSLVEATLRRPHSRTEDPPCLRVVVCAEAIVDKFDWT